MSNTNSKRPTHTVRLLPAPGATSDSPWPFVGAAWVNADGSFNIKLEQELPVGSRVQVKARKPASTKPAKEAKASKAPSKSAAATP